MNKLIILIGLAGFFSGCEKQDFTKGTPKCIENKLKEIAKGEVWNAPAKIYSYKYDGNTVYYFPPSCCDVPGTLYDENCNIICSPDGGFTGGGDGKCSDFFNSRTDEKLIWEDARK